jgi:hypothetical protein
MIVTDHAYRRAKKRNIAPKRCDRNKVHSILAQQIQSHTKYVYHNKKTNSDVFVCDKCVIVIDRGVVKTVYKKDEDYRTEL